MDLTGIIFVLFAGTIVLAIPLISFVLSIISFRRSRHIHKLLSRVSQLESQLTAFEQLGENQAANASTAQGIKEERSVAVATLVDSVSAEVATVLPTEGTVGWETFVGQKAFGWLAVLLFGLSATFFLRYAFQNNWIGPVGRVAIGESIGIALLFAGLNYHRRLAVRFASMLTAAGIIVIYLATYSAFGFYRLVPQSHAGVFLAIVVLESMLAAVVYRSTAVALAAVIGGLLTPVLLASDYDSYQSFFIYLIILNFSTVLAGICRRWPAVTSICYFGTQALYWMWYSTQYHPEKSQWALGFQLAIFTIYLGENVAAGLNQRLQSRHEDLARLLANGLLFFYGIHVLLRDEYSEWLGIVALGMASIYSVFAQLTLRSRPTDNRLLLASLSLALGFIAWAIPLQANSHWVALGWAVMGASLWWFGLRLSSPTLRVIAGLFGIGASSRLLFHDLAFYVREPFIPILNSVAIPSLGVACAILIAVVLTNPYLDRLKQREQTGVGLAAIVGVALLWLVLTLDCYGYFLSQSIFDGEIDRWRWRGQLALTTLWTLFATCLLVLGFQLQRARLRWMAIALYGVTVMKLFLVDMANVQQFYRILAFFGLAVVLGLVARAYQRFK